MQEAATVREWTDLLRRIRLGANVRVPGATRGVRGATVRAVALMLATFADGDGSRAFPGTARLAVSCELDYRTTKRCLAILRHLGLITAVRTARRRGHADQYQLTIPADLLERLEVLSPADVEAAVERIRKSNRRGSDGPDGPGTGASNTPEHDEVRVPEEPVPDDARVQDEPVDPSPADSSTGAGSTTQTSSTGAGSTVLRVPVCPPTHHDLDTTPTHQHHLALRTDSAHSARANATAEIPDSDDDKTEPDRPSPEPAKCPHRFPIRRRSDGTPTCALCRKGLPGLADHLADVIPLRSAS